MHLWRPQRRRIAREEAARPAAQAQMQEEAPLRTRPFEDGELSFTFNEESLDPKNPSDSGGDGDDDGPGHDHRPDGPGNRRRRRRGKGYGYRRGEE